MASAAVHVLIASPLEAEHANRIAAADSRVRLLYEPDLLPLPRYPCDHDGVQRELGAAGLARWAELRALAVPLAEFALFGLLYFAKAAPVLAAWQAGRHWEPHATRQLHGSRAVLVGLGGIGREIARLLASAGVLVTGVGRPGRGYQVPGVTSYADDTQLAAVLPQADALILACPLTERTLGSYRRRGEPAAHRPVHRQPRALARR